MIDILIPLVGGILLLTKPDMFIRKEMEEDLKKKKKNLYQKIGWVLIGVSILYFLSKILINASCR
ncbi:hypothetical protein KAI68_08565 [bacterium]|nr:hypothetical protein [bacterium]